MTATIHRLFAFIRAASPLLITAAVATVLVGFALTFAAYNAAFEQSLRGLEKEAAASAQLRASVLQSEIDKQRTVPAVLAADSGLQAALTSHAPEAAKALSLKLEALRRETGSAVIYVLDPSGTAVAASNWNRPESFVGSNYRFRDYFTQALSQDKASQFALGTVSHIPGLFLSHSVKSGGQTVGVAVVKLEFTALEAEWGRLNEVAFVTDRHNDVVIAGNPAWRFKQPQPPTRDQTPAALPIPGVDGWQIHVYRSLAPAKNTALAAAAITGLAELLVAGLGLWFWRRQSNLRLKADADLAYLSRLEFDVGQRTHALRHANDLLSKEIEERHATELRLNTLQADLVQANKLAQLGQITAGVAHEINQPLATIRVLADNALRGLKPALVKANLENIVAMSERIGHITGELRAFSRKASGRSEPTSVLEAVEGSILLTHSRVKAHKVRFRRPDITPGVKVWAERVRLEQVLVNLLQNAFEAVEGVADAQVSLRCEVAPDQVRLLVEDNGPGLPDTVKKALFIPFTTTKPKGLGLGLVIARDILSDFGGELAADTEYVEGARFIVTLRRVVP